MKIKTIQNHFRSSHIRALKLGQIAIASSSGLNSKEKYIEKEKAV